MVIPPPPPPDIEILVFPEPGMMDGDVQMHTIENRMLICQTILEGER